MPELVIEKGADRTAEIPIYVVYGRGGPVVAAKCNAAVAAGVTTIPIDRLKFVLTSGDMLAIPDPDTGLPTLVVTLGADAAIGAASLTVTATAGAIKAGEVLQKLSNLTGYTMEMEVLVGAGDATPLIPSSDLPVTMGDQTTIAGRGRALVAFGASDTSGLAEAALAGALWRTDTGNKRKLWFGTVNIVAEGFTS